MVTCPFSDNCPYLDREPELLVVNGYRHWVAGYQTGDAGHWSEAWNLFAVRLGPRAARPVIGQLSSWVKSICLWRTEPLNLFHVGCRYICRDECLAASMVAAGQHDDMACLRYCAGRLCGPDGGTETVEAAIGLASSLKSAGRDMMPVPLDVVRGLVERPPTSTLH